MTATPAAPPDDAALAAAKAALRRICLERRAAWPGDRAAAARDAAGHFLRHIPRGVGAVVASYVAMKDELDPLALIESLAAAGHPIALPVVGARGEALRFRRWFPGEALIAGPFGTREPAASAPDIRPGLLIVPLLAFDGTGARLGYGAGYYDRALLKLRAAGPVVAVGFALSAQRVERVPTGALDQRLDWVVTEKGAEAFP